MSVCLLLSMLIGVPRFLTVSSANLLFLAHHPATHLPYAYAVSAFAIAAVGFLYGRAEKRIGFSRTSVWATGILALNFAVVRFLYDLPGTGASTSFAMVLLAEIEFSLCTLAFWGVANRLFNVREAGKIFGIIGAGEILPSIVGGLFLEEIVATAGLSNLFGGAALGHLTIALALVVLGQRARASESDGQREYPAASNVFDNGASHRRDTRTTFFWLVASMLFLSVVSTYWVDNAFLFSLQEHFDGGDARARFLGRFFVAMGLANLAFKFVVAHRWREWFGGRKTLLSTPVVIAAVATMVLVLPFVIQNHSNLIWTVILLKLCERVLLESVNNPAYFSLFQAFPMEHRTQIQGRMETVVAQSATLFAGVFLLLVELFVVVRVQHLLLLVLLICAAWMGAAHFSWRAYIERILFALQEGRLHPGFIDMQSEVSVRLLRGGLSSKDSSQVLFSLRKLEACRPEELRLSIVHVCEHPDDAVRDAACTLMEARGWKPEAEELMERWFRSSEDDKRQRGRWLRTFATLSPAKCQTLLATELEHDAVPRRLEAAVAILQANEPGKRYDAMQCLQQLLQSSDATTTEAALAVLPRLAGFWWPEEAAGCAAKVQEQLASDDASTKALAVRAVLPFSEPFLWDRVVLCLAEPLQFTAASQTLLLGRAHATDALARWLHSAPADAASDHREAAATHLAKLDPGHHFTLLIKQLGLLQSPARAAVLAAIRPRDFIPNATERELLKQVIDDERAELATIGRIWQGTRSVGIPTSLDRGLFEEWERGVRVLVHLIGLLAGQHEVQGVGRWWGTPLEDRELALEYLETSLRELEHTWLIPVLESGKPVVLLGASLGDSHAAASWTDSDSFALDRHFSGSRAWLAAGLTSSRAHATNPDDTAAVLEQDDVLSRLHLLERVEALCAMPKTQLAALGQRGIWTELSPGETWTVPSETESFVATIAQGSVRLHHPHGCWKRGAQSFVGRGWMAAAQVAEPPFFRVTALEPTSLFCVTESDFETVCQRDPDAAWYVLHALAAIVQGATSSIAQERESVPVHLRGARVGHARHVDRNIELERALALRGMKLFAKLDDETLLAVAQAAVEISLEPGEYLCAAGDTDAKLLIVIEGNVRVYRGETTLAQLQGPCVLGELGAITGANRVASVQAETFCRVLHLERAAFYELMMEHRSIMASMRDILTSMRQPEAAEVFFAKRNAAHETTSST